MAWWRKGRAGKSPEETEGAEPEIHASPSFEALSGWLERVRQPRVLDLGSAVGPNLDYFAQRSTRLQVVSLFSALEDHPGGPARREQAPDQVFRNLLPDPSSGRFDAVLLWDLFNYLSRSQMHALGAQLAELCRPGGQALAMVSNRPQIPEAPIHFRIADAQTLVYSTDSARLRANPRWPPGEVQKALSAFDVERSFLLRHGIQEFLLVRPDAPLHR